MTQLAQYGCGFDFRQDNTFWTIIIREAQWKYSNNSWEHAQEFAAYYTRTFINNNQSVLEDRLRLFFMIMMMIIL
jgi:hypothetical protein